MSLLTRRPGILVVDHLSGRGERVHHNAPASWLTGFAVRRIRVDDFHSRSGPKVAMDPDAVTAATDGSYVTAGSYVRAGIASAIAAS